MAGIKSFTDIQAWQKARLLVKLVYEICNREPICKDWGFRNQNCRAAISAMSNIAEGFGRASPKEFSRYLDIARGSVTEVQSLVFAAKDIGYVTETESGQLLQVSKETISLIAGFKRYLKNIG